MEGASAGDFPPESGGDAHSGADQTSGANSLTSDSSVNVDSPFAHDESETETLTENSITDTQISDNSVRPKSQRAASLSVKGRESKAYTLNTEITKLIIREIKYFDKIDFDRYDHDYLNNCLTKLHAGFSEIDAMYHELILITDNKTSETTNSSYSSYSSEFNAIKDRLQENLAMSDKELQIAEEIVTQARKELEEQEKTLAALMATRTRIKPRVTSLPENQSQITRQTEPATAVVEETDTGETQPQTGLTDSTYEDTRQLQRQETQLSISNIQPFVVPSLPSPSQTTQKIVVVRTPKSIEPETFDNNPIKFPDWEVDFDTYLRVEDIRGADSLRHLKKFVSGEAKRAIEGFFILASESAYVQARQLLKERYGNRHEICRSFRSKLDKWPKISTRCGKELRDFGDFLAHISGAMISIPELRILDDCNEIIKLIGKLPDSLRNRWIRSSDKTYRNEDRYPNFKEFSNFIKDEARIMLNPFAQGIQPAYHQEGHIRDNNFEKKTTRSFHTNSNETKSDANTRPKCNICTQQHRVLYCPEFKTLNITDRLKAVKAHKLCFGCLRPYHWYAKCHSKEVCTVCKGDHPTIIHRDQTIPEQTEPANAQYRANSELNQEEEKDTTPLSTKATNISRDTLGMVSPVYVKAEGKEMLVNLLYDSGADCSFLCNEIGRLILPRCTEERVTVHTMNGAINKKVKRYQNITIRGMLTNDEITIKAYGQDNIYLRKSQIPVQSTAQGMEHLTEVAKLLPPDNVNDIPIGLVIGGDYPEILFQHQTIEGPPGMPFAAKTMFGWTLCGGRNETSNKHSYRTDITKDRQIINILAQDFKDCDDYHMSQNDIKFMNIVEAGCRKQPDGKYVIPLPLSENTSDLQNNKQQALRRYGQLKKKLDADKEYKLEYSAFMEDLLTSGHAEKAKTLPEGHHVWYLPHFGVRHPQKRKLRVVFDASAKFNGVSLNDVLLQGPDMMNSLIGILLRFRREEVAVCCDIEKMFYNFLVPEDQRNVLRFLWQEKEYRMTVHLFGATSSPAVATFGLRKIAEDNKAQSPVAANFLKHDAYVDDCITSVPTAEDAIKLIKDSVQICRQGGIRLHKIVSNNKKVIEAIPPSERSESTKSIDLERDKLPSERTLGLEWNTEIDAFHFKVINEHAATTKRAILSAVARIYDPLGFLAPYILKGKLVLQRVTKSEKNWDDEISSTDRKEWNEWTKQVHSLTSIHIPRRIKRASKENHKLELHHFADASLAGYGACSYIRQVSEDGKVANCALLLAKSRVAPLNKAISVPRLELQAAVTAVRVRNTVVKELQLPVHGEFFWSDSSIVLGYIANESKRFHMYVANRVFEIHQSSLSTQWNHVKSEHNPADMLSRGADVKELKDHWFNGPEFLWEKRIEDYIKENEVPLHIDEKDTANVRTLTAYRGCTEKETNLCDRFGRYSDWEKLVRSIATLKSVVRNRKWQRTQLTVPQLREAEKHIIRSVQTTSLGSIKSDQIKKQLRNLTPFADEDGILRVGGRMENAPSFSNYEKHPAIIPKHSYLARLLVKYYHEKIHHLGRRSTLAAVREAGFWIISGTTITKSIVSACTKCIKLRGNTETQLMGNLPEERLHRAAPFTHCGMDVFGPFEVKDRRSVIKRYGLLFTCLYSRACHIETLYELTTASFINALRRFIAIRGNVTTLFSDNGTNFIGARNLFEREILQVKDAQLKEYLLSNRIEFKTNVPHASEKGGAWERTIRSARAVLNGMSMKYKERLDTETLQTAFMEVTAVLNSMPLAATNIGAPDEEVVTPNMLLTTKRKSTAVPPPGQYDGAIYGKDQWRKAQQMADEFHLAWKTEYLTQLTRRQKWQTTKRNIEVGDIVLVTDQNNHRSQWTMGVVSDTHQGKDEKVREATLKLANRWLDMLGKPMAPATVIRRPINKLVLLLTA